MQSTSISSDISSQQDLMTEKNPTVSDKEIDTNYQKMDDKLENLNYFDEASESTQNQKEIMPLQISVFENTSKSLLPNSPSNEQTIHINVPNENTSQEIIDKTKELINNSEPLPKNDDNNNIQIESNNMELVSTNVQEVKNNTNVSTNESDLYESQINSLVNFEHRQQTLQQQNFNTTSSSWNTQPNNLDNTDQNFDREHHHKFRNHHSPNSQIGNERSNENNNINNNSINSNVNNYNNNNNVNNYNNNNNVNNYNNNNNNNNYNHNKAPFTLHKLTDAEFQALPPGSRLFLGNLSTHSTSKRELYDIFSPYGEVFEISIKNSFGFIQYDNPESIKKAIEKENGRILHGLRLGKEYSPTRGHHNQTHNDWHYNKEDHERRHSRDLYREEHHDQRASHRSKPYRVPNRDYLERKQSCDNRSQSQDKTNDEFPLPRRQGNQVPECQIIALEEVDRSYLWQVENAFREATISVHTLHLSRKLQIQAVVRQMIVEGVHAVVFLERALVINGKVNMQIFERQRSQDNVKYDEDAVGLLSRARVSSVPVPNNILMGGQQILTQAQQTAPIIDQQNASHINPISLAPQNTQSAQGIQPMQVVSPGANLQHQPGFMSAQSQNFDVQQILRHLAPANAPNQQPYAQVFPHSHQPTPFNTSMINQHNVNNPNF
ncbi:4876_t:CDS:2 [Entrophospora sp. SA101]|nr:4876_t:CDS:2 [Entrophospora sp. SA101]